MRTLAIITVFILVVSIIFNFALNNHLAETQLLQEITPLNDSNSSNQSNYLKPNFLLASETDTPSNSNTQSASDKIAEADLLVQRSMASASWWMVFSNIILVFTTFWLLTYNSEALRLANETQKAAMLANIFEHPPRITIQQISLNLLPDKPIAGECFIINEGSHSALVVLANSDTIRSEVLIYWTGNKLPQKHIIKDMTHRKRKLEIDDKKSSKWIQPGDAILWEFDSVVAITDNEIKQIEEGKIDLYVIGLVRYGDANDQKKGNHRTLFCRKYCPECQRYFPVNDDYYEYKS
jgi:hypothetical protein